MLGKVTLKLGSLMKSKRTVRLEECFESFFAQDTLMIGQK